MTRNRWPDLRTASLITVPLWLLCAVAALLTANTALAWGRVRLDDLRYGRPRVAVTSFDLNPPEAPGRPTAFVGINLDRQVIVLQTDNNDPTQARLLKGPYLFGAGADLVPVVLSHQDANGDGLQDLLLTLQGEIIVYLNDRGSFRLASPDERAAFARVRP